MLKKKHILIAPLGLFSLTTLSGVILMSSSVNANNNSVVDEISITVPESCTMTGTGMNTHNANISNGLYVPDIGSTTLHAFCNDNEGFAIYAAGYTGDEVGTTNSNKLVGTSAPNNAVIDTGTNTGPVGNNDNSNWAMKLTITQDSGDTIGTNAFAIDSAPNVDLPSEADQSATPVSFSNYHVVPNEYVKVVHKNSSTDMTANTGGVKLTTTYAAYISKTQPADTYSGQVIYALVHPASHIAPGALIPPTSCTTPVPGLKYMQNLTSSNKTTILSNMTEEAEYYLADKRDGKTYCVAKLKDGNLWMTQNLDHDIVTDGTVTYDNTTTDLGWNGTGYSTASWTPMRATYATNDKTWVESETEPESYDPGELYWDGNVGAYWSESDCIDAGGTWNGHAACNLITSTGNSHYHLGNYYNWTAAIAMNDSSRYTTSDTDVNQSICPTGWTLPKNGNDTSNGSFQYLYNQYGWVDFNSSIAIWNSTAYLSLTSLWFGRLNGVGYDGYFWSPVTALESSAYNAYAAADELNPIYESMRSYGQSVRCIAR